MRVVQTAGCWAAVERMKRGTPVQRNCISTVREAMMRLFSESDFVLLFFNLLWKNSLSTVLQRKLYRTST